MVGEEERFSLAPLKETERIPSLAAIVLWEPRIERHRTAHAARSGPPTNIGYFCFPSRGGAHTDVHERV